MKKINKKINKKICLVLEPNEMDAPKLSSSI